MCVAIRLFDFCDVNYYMENHLKNRTFKLQHTVGHSTYTPPMDFSLRYLPKNRNDKSITGVHHVPL